MKIVAASRHWEKKRLCGSGGHLCYFCLYKNPSARGKKQLFTRVRALLRLEKCLLVFFFLLEGRYCNIFITTKMSQFSHLPRSFFLLHPEGFSFNRDDTTYVICKEKFILAC